MAWNDSWLIIWIYIYIKYIYIYIYCIYIIYIYIYYIYYIYIIYILYTYIYIYYIIYYIHIYIYILYTYIYYILYYIYIIYIIIYIILYIYIIYIIFFGNNEPWTKFAGLPHLGFLWDRATRPGTQQVFGKTSRTPTGQHFANFGKWFSSTVRVVDGVLIIFHLPFEHIWSLKNLICSWDESKLIS